MLVRRRKSISCENTAEVLLMEGPSRHWLLAVATALLALSVSPPVSATQIVVNLAGTCLANNTGTATDTSNIEMGGPPIWGYTETWATVYCVGNVYTGVSAITKISYRVVRLNEDEGSVLPTLAGRIYDLNSTRLVTSTLIDNTQLPLGGANAWVTAEFDEVLDSSRLYWVPICATSVDDEDPIIYIVGFQNNQSGGRLCRSANSCEDNAQQYNYRFTHRLDYQCAPSPSPTPSNSPTPSPSASSSPTSSPSPSASPLLEASPAGKRHLCKCRPQLGSR